MAFGLAPANCDERKVGEFLVASDGHDAFLADVRLEGLWQQDEHHFNATFTLLQLLD